MRERGKEGCGVREGGVRVREGGREGGRGEGVRVHLRTQEDTPCVSVQALVLKSIHFDQPPDLSNDACHLVRTAWANRASGLAWGRGQL